MHGLFAIARLTWTEARRTRVALAAFVCAGLFLAVYGVAVFFVVRGVAPPLLQRQMQLELLTLVGLYVANFLTLAFSVMVPVDSISGEIDSGVMQTLASKPVSRPAIVLGKWFAFLALTAIYLLVVAGGVTLLVWLFTGFWQPHLAAALPLMWLGAAVLLTLSIAGGTRFRTVTNGIVVFGFYAIAFVGGWIEEFGFILGNSATRYIGTAISLVSPVDALWRMAAHVMQPPLMQQLRLSPFSSEAVPSQAMVIWALGYLALTLLVALRHFSKRSL